MAAGADAEAAIAGAALRPRGRRRRPWGPATAGDNMGWSSAARESSARQLGCTRDCSGFTREAQVMQKLHHKCPILHLEQI